MCRQKPDYKALRREWGRGGSYYKNVSGYTMWKEERTTRESCWCWGMILMLCSCRLCCWCWFCFNGRHQFKWLQEGTSNRGKKIENIGKEAIKISSVGRRIWDPEDRWTEYPYRQDASLCCTQVLIDKGDWGMILRRECCCEFYVIHSSSRNKRHNSLCRATGRPQALVRRQKTGAWAAFT